MSPQVITARRNMRRNLRPLAALAIVGLISVGCSNASAGTGTGAGTASSASSSTSTNHEKAVKFAECMRNTGVSGFPDPNASGELTIDAVANGSGVNPSSPAFKTALAVCKHLEPSGFLGSKRTPAQQSAGLRFAQCIRENGVSDFPDPLPNGPLVDTNRIPSTAQPGGMSILRAAMQKCRDAAAAAGVRR
jgi:hypothetical protein